jgi:hypothetical protein
MATQPGTAAATPLPRPEGGGAAALRMVLVWHVRAYVPVLRINHGGRSGLAVFRYGFLSCCSKRDAVIGFESSDLQVITQELVSLHHDNSTLSHLCGSIHSY